MYRLNFCKKYKDWSSEQWGNVIFSDDVPFFLELLGKDWSKGEKVNVFLRLVLLQQLNIQLLFMYGFFSSKGVGALTLLPKTP